MQSISGVSAINPSRLLRHPWTKERGAIFYFVPDTTRDELKISLKQFGKTTKYQGKKTKDQNPYDQT
jgi:hypothetical protein